jgi:hypothetical protein
LWAEEGVQILRVVVVDVHKITRGRVAESPFDGLWAKSTDREGAQSCPAPTRLMGSSFGSRDPVLWDRGLFPAGCKGP